MKVKTSANYNASRHSIGDGGDLSDNKITVLVVNEDRSVVRSFERVLERNGYEVDTARTGKEAMEKIKNRSYDVMLIDSRLPDMDGADLLIMTKYSLPDAVKMVITGLSSEDTVSHATEQGADSHLVKTVSPDELLLLIKEKLLRRIQRKATAP